MPTGGENEFVKKAWQPVLGIVFLSLGVVFAASGDMALAEESSAGLRLTLPAPGDAVANRKWSGEWKLIGGAYGFSEGKDEGTGAAIRMSSKFRYEFLPVAHFYLEPQIRYFSSRVQTRYEDDLMDTGFRLRNGYVGLGYEDSANLKAGILSQDVLRSDLVVAGGRAFPGLREQVSFGSAHFKVTAMAQQTVPTSYSLNTKRVERESTPTFLTETIELKITPAKVVEAEFYATHFRFNHLPAVVAFDSAILGNSVGGESAAGSYFLYSFDGFLIGTELRSKTNGMIDLGIGGQWVQNSSAPRDANRAQLIFLSAQLRPGHDIEFGSRLGTYFAESDVVPASYSDWDMGNTNRKGIMADVEMNFLRHGFRINLEYYQSATINDYAFQADKQVFFLELEMDYVPF